MSKEKKLLLMALGALILLICMPTIVNLLGSASTYVPKSGRVVDAATSTGMANVFVIAAASYGGQNLISGTYGGLIGRFIVRTDANGIYHIPSTWGNAHLWVPPAPGTASYTQWKITVFKPGYAVEGDETSWSEFDSDGQPIYMPRSIAPRQVTTIGFGEIEIEPFKMQAVKLTLKQASFYYHAIAGSVREASLEEYSLRKLGFDFFLPQVCSLDSVTELDLTTFNALREFAENPMAMDMRMKEFEPQNWGKTDTPSPKYLAGDVCSSMKDSGDKR